MPYRSESLQAATANYARYCIKNGPARFTYNPAQSWNQPLDQDSQDTIEQNINNNDDEQLNIPATKKTKTSDLIRDKIEAGARPKELYREYPGSIPLIKQLLPLHPIYHKETLCLYIWGPTGVGKTVNLKRVLNYFRDTWSIFYYFKMGGLSKFFNGYNFDDIVVIDDPVEPSKSSNDEITMFKAIINEHERQIEIKGSSMPWDTRLVIITSNVSPKSMAEACGDTCKEAIFRRLTSPFQSVLVRQNEHTRYLTFLAKIIAKVFDIWGITPEEVLNDLEPVQQPLSDVEY